VLRVRIVIALIGEKKGGASTRCPVGQGEDGRIWEKKKSTSGGSKKNKLETVWEKRSGSGLFSKPKLWGGVLTWHFRKKFNQVSEADNDAVKSRQRINDERKMQTGL